MDQNKKIKIESIKIKTSKGKEIILELEEAKELFDQLKELFGDKTTYVPYSPIIIERWPKIWYDQPWTITWGTTGDGVHKNHYDIICSSGMNVSYNYSEINS